MIVPMIALTLALLVTNPHGDFSMVGPGANSCGSWPACLATIWMDVSDNQDGCCCGVQPEGGRSPTVG